MGKFAVLQTLPSSKFSLAARVDLSVGHQLKILNEKLISNPGRYRMMDDLV